MYSIPTGHLSMALKRLQVLDKVHVEIRRHILKSLQTSSVTKCNSYCLLLETNLDQIPNFSLTNDEILDKADGLYRELLETGEWTSAKYNTPANAFVSEDPTKDESKGAFVSEDSNGSKCRRCGQSHPGKPCSITHWKFVPSRDDENEERSVRGKTWYWCGKCRRWNLTHKTHQHVRRESIVSNDKDNQRKPPVDVSPSTVASSTTSSSTTPTVAIAQYDMSVLNNCRRSFFKNHFQSFK